MSTIKLPSGAMLFPGLVAACFSAGCAADPSAVAASTESVRSAQRAAEAEAEAKESAVPAKPAEPAPAAVAPESSSRDDEKTATRVNDGAGPQIAWVDVPASVTAGTSFTATFTLKDQSGVDPQSPNVKIGGAPGLITSWCGTHILATLASGSATSGIWSMTCAVPATAVTGSYSLSIDAQDTFANWASLGADFDVVGGSADDKAPAISSVVVPAKVARGAGVTFTWKATDATGVANAVAWVFGPSGIVDSKGVLVVDYGNFASQRTAGSSTEGTYAQTVTVPATAELGTYSLWLSVADDLGNKTYEPYATFTVD
jgi:hypothetical protein